MHAHKQASATLRELLIENRWNQGERLPSLAGLAALCGVSRNTMWKSLAALKKEQRVHTTARGAIIAGPEGVASAPGKQSGFVWERLKERIGREIVGGTLTGPRLPLVSKLAIAYDVSPITLRKALAALADEGLLTLNGRRYCVHATRHYHLSTVIVVSNGNSSEGIDTGNERTVALIDSFERECPRSSTALRLIAFDAGKPGDRLSVLRAVRQTADVAGFVVNLWSFWDPLTRPRWMDLIGTLALLGKPLIIADQAGDLVLPREIAERPNVRTLRISGVRAGEITADFALRRGHRSLAYIAPDTTATWARNRRAGLAGFLKQFGSLETNLQVFGHLHPLSDLSSLVIELLDLDPGDVRSLFGDRYSAAGLEMALQSPVDHLPHPTLPADGATIETLRAAGRHLALFARERPPTDVYNKLFDAFYDRASTYAATLHLGALFDRVLHESPATLWVCSDDKTGDAALSYLNAKRIPIPQKVALVSFDNLRWSKALGLSSYDFNMTGMGMQALRLIQDDKSLKSQPAVVEVDGYVVERMTSRLR